MRFSLSHVLLLAFLTVGYVLPAEGYGPLGHEIVGAIADERLAGTPTAAKIAGLLDGLNLEKASVIADEIKGWDRNGADDPRSFHFAAHRRLNAQVRDFWRANQPTQDMNSAAPSHHWFHYTDVPVVPEQDYRGGKIGRSKWDIVHMIPYCLEVLQGRMPEQNERKITKPVALILLAHYVGDLHQPLHVGAEYFDSRGRVVDPDKDKPALGDEGGNTFTLELSDDPPLRRGIHKKKFHGFWDYDTVNALFPQLPLGLYKDEFGLQIEPLKRALVHQMATQEPRNWQTPAAISVTDYAEAWANEILPVAREAHTRLEFHNVRPFVDGDRVVAAGEAIEKTVTNHTLYRTWANSIVRDELHKSGWRLADLLQKIL
ncbi:MAG TPA: S1/P1 nuclease [Candidatus Udaeobacter sp.]|jgi:hypothetical protein|nr:S1/P1 nuclease [Candidatus Udaeobacter sp.]